MSNCCNGAVNDPNNTNCSTPPIFPVAQVVQNIGESTLNVMSQNATTIAISATNFNIVGNATVVDNGSNVVITIIWDSSIAVFDAFGGYRFIKGGTYTLLPNQMFVLSKSNAGYDAEYLHTKGNGEMLYLYPVPYSLGGYSKIIDIVAFMWDGGYQTRFECFKTNPKLNNFSSTFKYNRLQTGISVANLGYFLNISNGSNTTIPNFTVPNTGFSTLLLSSTQETYTKISIVERLNGNTSYCWVESNWENVKNYPDAIILGYYDGTNFTSGESGILFSEQGANLILPDLTYGQNNLDLATLQSIKAKNKDVTIVLVGDSISTNNNYTTPYSDAAYRPPMMDEQCYSSLLTEDLLWEGQKYRRYDASGVFTETATTKEDKIYDAAWDWTAAGTGNFFNAKTRVLTGTNASVSFIIPANTKQAAFIYRTDYLWAPNTTVSVGSGNGKCRIKTDSGNIEANGYVFSGKETDTIISTPFGSLRKSQNQKRLIFRFDDISTDTVITITNSGSGRLNYWGIEYSKYEYMIRFINSARGGHTIAKLRNFEEWDVDYWKPDLILQQCCVINEDAKSENLVPGNTPAAFAGRFETYVTALKAKVYQPDVVSYCFYIGVQAGIVNQTTGEYNCEILDGTYYVDTYSYIGALETAIKPITTFINGFNTFDSIATALAKRDGTNNKWTSAINGSGFAGSTFTQDTVHLNNYGSTIAYRILRNYLFI